jgi:hypothetical protein
MTSPNIRHASPSNCISRICSIGKKSSAPVSMVMPGSIMSVEKFFKFAACFMTFWRVSSSPHCFNS